MVRCDLWSNPESPHNSHYPALILAQRDASSPLTGDALAQPMK
jgi:hypothetical protein